VFRLEDGWLNRVRELSLELDPPNNESLLRVLELNLLMLRLLVRLSVLGLKREKVLGDRVVVVVFSVVRILKSRNRVRLRVGGLEVVVADWEEEKEEPENLDRDLDLVRERGGDSSGTETCRLK